eukprot:1666541-Ditylum_brightwellii.AAC.1
MVKSMNVLAREFVSAKEDATKMKEDLKNMKRARSITSKIHHNGTGTQQCTDGSETDPNDGTSISGGYMDCYEEDMGDKSIESHQESTFVCPLSVRIKGNKGPPLEN